MKLSNKILIISSIVCLFAVFVMGYTVFKIKNPGTETNKPKSDISAQKTDKVQKNISQPIEGSKQKEKYLLRLEDDKICGYMVLSDGSLALWNSVMLPPTLTNSEKEELKKGIPTDSFEKLCLYFESYAS